MIPSTLAIPAIFLLTLRSYYLLAPKQNCSETSSRINLSFLLLTNFHDASLGPLAFPVIGNLHLLGKLPHRSLQSLANKYGSIMLVWLGQVPTFVVSSSEAAELFLKAHDPAFADRPQTQASDYIFYGSKDIVFSNYGSYWRYMKKIGVQYLFSASTQELIGHVRRKELKMVLKSLENAAKTGGAVDISEKVHGLLEDLVYKIILGRNKDSEFDLKGLVSEALRLTGAFNLADIVPWLGVFDLQGLTKRFKEISRKIDQLLEKIITEHEQAPNSYRDGKHKDFIDVVLSLLHQSQDDEQNHEITRDNIKAATLSMIAGSYETSAVTIEWTLSELLRNPRVMKNLQDELETVVGMNRMVNETDLSKLNYLNMVVLENFRLHPVAPVIPRAATKDITVGGYHIKTKSQIFINLWALGRDPQVWSDNTDVFYPERFLNSNPPNLQEYDRLLFSFGAGRRKCPGMQVGLTTVKLAIAQLVHCFNWELPFGMKPNDLDMTESFGSTLQRSKHLSAMLTHRLPSNVYKE